MTLLNQALKVVLMLKNTYILVRNYQIASIAVSKFLKKLTLASDKSRKIFVPYIHMKKFKITVVKVKRFALH